jgi:hypothetical protein
VPAWALPAALAALFTIAASASAAQVSVEEAPGKYGEMEAALLFRAAPGENNHLTVRTVSRAGEMLGLRLLDGKAAIAPGPGCRGGGSIGAPVRCELHKARGPGEGPGTWIVGMAIHLGDGDNRIDASSFTGPEDLEMYVTSGPGQDVLATGRGDDSLDPGAGRDLVKSGGGYDVVQSDARPEDQTATTSAEAGARLTTTIARPPSSCETAGPARGESTTRSPGPAESR